MKFLKYLFSYKVNSMKLSNYEAQLEGQKDKATYNELKYMKANNALRQIHRLLAEYEKGGSFYAPIYRQIKEIVDDNVEKKLSDEIFSHYTSNNS